MYQFRVKNSRLSDVVVDERSGIARSVVSGNDRNAPILRVVFG